MASLFRFATGIATVLIGAAITSVTAQLTNITCPINYNWMTNSRLQNPCLVAAYLQSVCDSDPATSDIQLLPPDHHYILRKTAASNCTCNTVFYCVMSACTACQARDSLPWSGWSENCTYTFVSQYPKPIPEGTAIPAWAYYNITPLDRLNLTIAENIAHENLTDSTAIPVPSSTSFPSLPSTSPFEDRTNDTKTKNLGAIISGVIGGITLIAIISVTTVIWRRLRRLTVSKQCNMTTQVGTELSTESDIHDTLKDSEVKLYNPEDPSTFPRPDQIASSHIYQPNRYNGLAEL
ncbi:hypothetical protein BDY19DRAFT_204883 [Irpex rosettiformis]|uniref:Uncharacterized protein n=1 Tax=Irpex rosettiformis TaxID=378272 RepID=A0ACB8U0Z4_9APHY|nr:hypothetical protein BDY19DRAFT_204883 [Irpex rosettiformis]